MENGSDRASNSNFTDDDPQNGVAKAKAVMEAQMNEAALVAASEGVAPVIGNMSDASVPLEGKDLENRADIPEFNKNIQYPDGTLVKKQMDDGTYILGKASSPNNKNISIFTAVDKQAVSEHTSFKDELKSYGLGLISSLDELIEENHEEDIRQLYQGQVIMNENNPSLDIDLFGVETKGKTADEMLNEYKEKKEEWRNNNLKKYAPCKSQYDDSEQYGGHLINIASLISGGKGPSVMFCGVKNANKVKGSTKLANEAKNIVSEEKIIRDLGNKGV
ncbi:MAG: hypothetical protein IJH34_15085, partial [Romboutsia sp.]|nr:hypothetical protein [Romboutsia sp.]